MAETERHDRTEPATPKRLDDARREGRIPRSRDLTAAAVMVTAGIALKTIGDTAGTRLGDMMKTGLAVTRERAFDPGAMTSAFAELALMALYAVAPLMLLTM